MRFFCRACNAAHGQLFKGTRGEEWLRYCQTKPLPRYNILAVDEPGPQPLFVDTFGQNCGAVCNQMVVWTSYYPPRSPFENTPAVQQYVNAIRSVSASADIDNQFLEGGYSGMETLVAALQKLGPIVTRAGLRATLDAMTLNNGLSSALTWRPGKHYSNVSMQSFSIQYNNGFNGFRSDAVGWVNCTS